MILFVADENFNGRVLNDVLQKYPEFDVVRVRDTEIYQASDPVILEWAAVHERVWLTHDTETLIGFAYDRIRAGLPMPGIVRVPEDLPIGQVIDTIILIAGASDPADWENKVTYFPLR